MKENWGLYNSSFEHDACGIGAVVNIKGKKSNKLNSFTNYSRKIQGSRLSSLYSYS